MGPPHSTGVVIQKLRAQDLEHKGSQGKEFKVEMRSGKKVTGYRGIVVVVGTPGVVPSSHYYLRSFSWASRTFYFSDSRDLIEVLRGLPWQRERESLGNPPGP